MYTIEKNSGPSLIKNIDWFMIANVIILNAVGLIVLRGISSSLFMKQLVASILGIAVMIVVMLIDYKDLKLLGIPAFAATLILLVVVLVAGTGKEETGTQGWLDLGPISFQPSELGKVTLVIVAAYFFEKIRTTHGIMNYILLLASAGILVGMVLLQPDFGTAMVYVFIFLVMLFISGIKYRFVLIGLGALVVLLPLLWFTVLPNILDDFQMKRILSFLNPQAYENTAAYQVRMAIRYIGTGLLTGKGIGAGSASGIVPASDTDSIFAVLGEEMGFVGATFVIALFAIFLLRCLYVSRFAKDRYGNYLVAGMMAMFMFHFIENIGMNIGILPVTGIPLPFISNGGSSVIVNYIAVGIIVSVSMRRQRPMFEV